MPLRDVDLSRIGLGREIGIPNLRTGLQPSWTGWGVKREPQNLWQRITPWKEEQGETFGSAVIAPVAQGVSDVFRTVGTPLAAPFLRAQMTPEEKRQMDVEWNENPWSALFGRESTLAQKYEKMPWWAKLLAEAPATLVGAGVAGAGIKAIAGTGLERLAAQTGFKGAAARIGAAALTPFGGEARQVFTQAGRAGGVSGRLAQAISAPTAGIEAATGAITKAGLKALTPTQRALLKRLKLPQDLSETQQYFAAKLTGLIKRAPSMIRETGELRSKELGKRVARVAATQERLTGEQAFTKAAGFLGGKLPTAKPTRGFEKVRQSFTKEEINDGFDAIRTAKFAAPKEHLPLMRQRTSEGLQKLLLGEIPQRNEIQLLENVFGKDLAKAVLDKRSLGSRAFEMAMDIANVPRAILSSVDLSGLLRQGGILTARHPLEGAKSVKPMLRALFSDKNAGIVDDIIRADDDIAYAIRNKFLDLPVPPHREAAALAERAEPFMSSIAEKIPVIGPLIKASNRAYVSGLNQLRANVYKNNVNAWRKLGLIEERIARKSFSRDAIEVMRQTGKLITDNDLSELGKFIMNASGRGSLGKLQGASPLLNSVFFSPKLLIGRAMLPTSLISSSKLVRQEAWKTMMAFIGGGASLLSMAKLSGAAEIELDTTSADFGKIKIGDTRLDIWSGYQQYFRLLSTLAQEERKTAAGAKVPANRWDTLVRFAESKASPAAGLLVDILKGQTFLGEEITTEGGFLVEQAYQRIAPLAIQDMIDAMENDGPLGGLIASPSFLGIGVMSYPPPTDEQIYKAEQQMAYLEIEDNVWSTIPNGRELYKKYEEYNKTDKMKARRFLAQYPQIVRAIKRIELDKRRWVLQNQRRFRSLGTT